jgi:WXG100 family type VII secretion target
MGEIKVAFAALEAARADVVGTATRIAGRLDDLRRAVVPLAATWEGQAAQEYRGRQRQWDVAAADLTRCWRTSAGRWGRRRRVTAPSRRPTPTCGGRAEGAATGSGGQVAGAADVARGVI